MKEREFLMDERSPESYIKEAAVKLEKVYNEVQKTQGYTPETEKLRILVELAKEQINGENSGT